MITLQNIKTRSDIPALLKSLRTTIGVELGVYKGDFSKEILEGTPSIKLYSIDRWKGDRGHDVQEYMFAVNNLQSFGNRSVVLRVSFDDALPCFPDDFFDFIYLDGYAHTGQEGGKTLSDWWPKLKVGGIFAGHDYHPQFPLTIKAVDDFVKEHNIKDMTLTTDDQYPSWLFQKEA